MMDLNLLSGALKARFEGRLPMADRAWPFPALNVLDCVLSLNRSYHEFCWPRVYGFACRNPEVISLRHLRALIRRYPSPMKFGQAQLDVKDTARMGVLVAVVRYLLRVGADQTGDSEFLRLRAWAQEATPEQCESLGIPGFKLAGCQYLRMLFGAQTLKPDMHTIEFVKKALGRRVSPAEALSLLESVGRKERWPIGDLDFAIWERGARKGSRNSKHEIEVPVDSRAILTSHASNLFGVRFDGFERVASLRDSRIAAIPDKPGVYLVLRPLKFAPKFLEKSPAGWFKGKDPTAPVLKLRKAWTDGAYVLYVGKAGGDGVRATLRSRLQCYLAHGSGKPVAHWGGRYVWQLAASEGLLIAWRSERKRNPLDAEQTLIDQFEARYGKKPFANLRR